MLVISDASSLISLAAVGQLEILRHLYGRIVIPNEVHAEVVLRGSGKPGAIEVRTATW
jgi:predicted nucleic acid-binding protein